MSHLHSGRFGQILFLVLTGLVLVACGGGGGAPEPNGGVPGAGGGSASYSVSGTAAMGKAFQGSINAYGRNGGSITGIPIDAAGKYNADLSGLTPPFLLEAVPDDSMQDRLYSFSAASGMANITPMTTLALFLANNQQDPTSLAASWPANATAISSALPDAQKLVNVNFQGVFSAVDPSLDIDFNRYNFFREPFDIGDTYDQILDLLSLNLTESSPTITVNGKPVAFDEAADISTIFIEGIYGELSLGGADVDDKQLASVYMPSLVVPPSDPTAMTKIVGWGTQWAETLNLTLYNDRLGQVIFAVYKIDSTGTQSFSYKIDCYDPVAGDTNAAPDCSKISVDLEAKRLTFNQATLKNIDTVVGETFGANGATAPLTLDGSLIWQ